MLGGTAALADEAKVPATPDEHQAMAKQYREEAANFKKVADEHRAMAAAYAEKHVPTNGPRPNVLAEKMKKHCEAIAKDADKAAHDAEMAATYHEQRAKELPGK
jgi:hypothetical protein